MSGSVSSSMTLSSTSGLCMFPRDNTSCVVSGLIPADVLSRARGLLARQYGLWRPAERQALPVLGPQTPAVPAGWSQLSCPGTIAQPLGRDNRAHGPSLMLPHGLGNCCILGPHVS